MPDVTRLRRVMGRAVAVIARHEQTVVVRVLRRMKAVDGYDRALARSAQAFVALVPLVVLVSALLPAGARESEATVAARLGLSGDAASAVSVLVRPGSRRSRSSAASSW